MSASQPATSENRAPGAARRSVWTALVPIVVCAGLAVLPAPEGLTPNAWRYFALFVGVILGLILEPVPTPIIAVLGVTLGAALNLVAKTPSDSVKWALSGFSNQVVWLILAAYMFGLGYEKTGLGRRLALSLVKVLGRTTLGLGYAVALSDVVLGPFMPSNTARSGGTIYPIIRNIPEVFGSRPGESARKIGSYIMWTGLATTAVTSSLFMTANAPNVLGLDLVRKATQISVTWREWFFGFLPIGAVLLAAVPLLVYVVYPPEIKISTDAQSWAATELARLGAITKRELTMAGLAVVALVLWIFGGSYLEATTVAFGVVVIMVLTGVITWDDLIGYKQAWSMLLWFGTLVSLADGLKIVGFLDWFATHTAGALHDLPITWVIIGFVAIYYIVHYAFASLTAHATALMPVFLAAALTVKGLPMKQLSLMLCYTSGLSAALTPYASGPSAIFYGSGYLPTRAFWWLGLIFGLIFLAVFLGIGMPYLGWYLG
ncbi:MAG: DASS family sodium-coupled anion symporter [Deltaproteobacteria bacterium]|nr:MAG: DASS family sodium-coupled anion symporter [Deltaproteobacteria bacterium]TMQ11688.1 MAG: DASS family sodium-coupled anion symporter [Deltaproteobacteria bacterium]